MSNTYQITWECESCGNKTENRYNTRDNDLPDEFFNSQGRPSSEKLRGGYKKGVEGSTCKRCNSPALPIRIEEAS